MFELSPGVNVNFTEEKHVHILCLLKCDTVASKHSGMPWRILKLLDR